MNKQSLDADVALTDSIDLDIRHLKVQLGLWVAVILVSTFSIIDLVLSLVH